MKVHYARGFFPNENFPGGGGAESIFILKWGQILRAGTKQNDQFMLSKKMYLPKMVGHTIPMTARGGQKPRGAVLSSPQSWCF